MVIMECRQRMLEWLLQGFKLTGIHLVGHNGASFVPFCMYDDIGSYVLLPTFIRLTGLTFEQAYPIFYFGMFGISITVALLSLYILFTRSACSRLYLLIGFLPLFFFMKIGVIGDVYMSYICAALCTIPPALVLLQPSVHPITQSIGFCSLGLLSQLFNYIRACASLGPLTFVIVYTLTSAISWQRKCILLALLFSGMHATTFYFNAVIARYENFIVQHCPEAAAMSLKHVFWHTVYLGFGFLKFWNTENIEWDDKFADLAVRSKYPSITIEQTEKYETALKEMTLELIKKRLFFVIMTIAAKSGILLFFFLLFMHFGLIAAAYIYRFWQLHISFFAALSLSTVFPLLAQPLFHYSASFITLTILYSVISVCYALQHFSLNVPAKAWHTLKIRFLPITPS